MCKKRIAFLFGLALLLLLRSGVGALRHLVLRSGMESRRKFMIDKRTVFVIAASLFMSATLLARSGGIEKETISGNVVAYDIGLELANGSCRQTIIVRAKKPDKVKQENEYIIVRYETPCMKLLSERLLEKGPQWKFSLTRDVDCDQELGELLYIKQLNPTGDVYRYPRLKFAPGAERERIPTDKKLACYVLRPGGFEPS